MRGGRSQEAGKSTLRVLCVTKEEKMVDGMSSEEILLNVRETICLIGRRKERFGKLSRRPRYSALKEPLLLLLLRLCCESLLIPHWARYDLGQDVGDQTGK